MVAAESLVGGEPREWNEKEADAQRLSRRSDEEVSGFDEAVYVFGQCIALRIAPA